jgi:hypothetical protein
VTVETLMSIPTAMIEPEFRTDPRGGYAVHHDGVVVGYVAKCERNDAVWEAYTDADRTLLRGQRGTRARAAAALLARPTRDVEIPDEALEFLARVILGDRPPAGAAETWNRVRDVVMLPTQITVAHHLRLAGHDVHDTYPQFAGWLNRRADEIDGGQR